MSNSDWKARLGTVYSTNPDFEYQNREQVQVETLPPNEQQLKVWIDRRQRGGKQVTLVKGFVGGEDELNKLATLLKRRCGVGGAVKEGEILIQGDVRQRVIEILKDEGYIAKKAGG